MTGPLTVDESAPVAPVSGARLIAVANQKGGVAKTTTVHSLGYALAELGRRVLLVDLDPQACLTYSAGINPEALDLSLHDVLLRRSNVPDACRAVAGVPGLDILPSSIDLGASEIALLFRNGREHFLSHVLVPVRDAYDIILMDCPPSLGMLTINALTAAHEVLIPFQCTALSTRGVGQLVETIEDVRMFSNADLVVRGVVATMYDHQTCHSKAMLAHIREKYGLDVLDPPVRRSIRFAEAPQVGRCIFQHAPLSSGAVAYRLIALRLDATLHAGAPLATPAKAM